MANIGAALCALLFFILADHTTVEGAATYACSFDDDCRSDFVLTGFNYQGVDRNLMDRDSLSGQFAGVSSRSSDKSVKTIENKQPIPFTGQQNCVELYFYFTSRSWRNCNSGKFKVEVNCGQDYQEKYIDRKGLKESQKRWNHITFNVPKGNCKLRVSLTSPENEDKERDCNDRSYAVDDIKVYNHACPGDEQPSLSTTLACNFNDNTCNWKSTGALNSWRRISDYAETYTYGTGPSKRYRLEYSRSMGRSVGSYLFLDSSASTLKNEAVLESPMVESSTPQCLRMYVNMHGDDIGQFRVFIVKINQQQNMVISKDGEQGKRWFEESIDLPVNVAYKVKMTIKTKLNGILGDIALDNFFVSEGECDPKVLGECDFGSKLQEPNACTYKLTKTPCNPQSEKANVKGVLVDTVRFTRENCPNSVDFYLSLPKSTVTPRKSCLKFNYRFLDSYCDMWLSQEWYDQNNRKRVWRKERLFDHPLGDLWSEGEMEMDYMSYGTQHKVKFNFHMRTHRCKNVQFANMRVVDQMCDHEKDKTSKVSPLGSLTL